MLNPKIKSHGQTKNDGSLHPGPLVVLEGTSPNQVEL